MVANRYRRGAIGMGLLSAFSLLLSTVYLWPSRPVRADVTFPQTGAMLWGPFEQYWTANGGLAQFGMPRTSVFMARDGYDAQWFERAMFTYNPRNPDPYKVELQLLGSMMTEKRRAEAPFKRAQPSGDGPYFQVTGHNLSGKLFEYWRTRGGLSMYGYPISEPFVERSKSDGKDYTVQYFERNRFELHPELAGTPHEIQLGLLGSELLDLQGGPAAFANLGPPRSYPQPAAGGNVPPGQIVQPPGLGTPSTSPPPALPEAPALPATNGPVIAESDFASADLSSWLPLSLLAPVGGVPASWRVSSGRLEQIGVAATDGSDDAAFLVTRDRRFSNFTMDAYYYPGSGEPLGAVFRQSDAGFYLLRLYPTGAGGTAPKATLTRFTGDRGTSVASSTSWKGYAYSRWQRLTITADGATLSVSIDGQPVLQGRDAILTSGAAGFYAFADGTAKFDNFRIVSK
jgi:hypothetical protein